MSKLGNPNRQEAEIRPFAGMSRIQPHAAGVDIGAHEIVVCVPGVDDTQMVRTFGSYTADLHALAAWLKEHQVETVAMESTGVYWIPLFETLVDRGLHCCLISANAIKRIPGRKSDVLDCQWIQTLHSYGLLAASFRPEADLVALRTLLRHRAQIIEHRSPHILHMQKALLQMNIQLSQALSDITGETGLRIIRAIVDGERQPERLAAMRNPGCKKSEAEIALALTGTWRAEHLFVLAQSLAFFDFFTAQLQACDAEIERAYSLIRPDWGEPPEPDAPLPPTKPGSHSKNAPQSRQVRQHLKRICGVDLVSVHGINAEHHSHRISHVWFPMYPAERQWLLEEVNILAQAHMLSQERGIEIMNYAEDIEEEKRRIEQFAKFKAELDSVGVDRTSPQEQQKKPQDRVNKTTVKDG